jgi:hypothetical protein
MLAESVDFSQPPHAGRPVISLPFVETVGAGEAGPPLRLRPLAPERNLPHLCVFCKEPALSLSKGVLGGWPTFNDLCVHYSH